jgi:hypothetical protein
MNRRLAAKTRRDDAPARRAARIGEKLSNLQATMAAGFGALKASIETRHKRR